MTQENLRLDQGERGHVAELDDGRFSRVVAYYEPTPAPGPR